MGLISRRDFLLAAVPAVQTKRTPGKAQEYPPEIRRYADPLTDRELWRLTAPALPHTHPHGFQRFIAHNNSFVVIAGRRDESVQLLRIDLPSGKVAQLSQGDGIAPYSICLSPDERSVYFLQGGILKQLNVRVLREREIYQVEKGWWATGELGISSDGRYAALVEMRSADRVTEKRGEERLRLQFERKPLCRIRLIETAKETSRIVAEEKAWIGRPQFRPRRDQILYCQIGPWEQLPSRMWLVNLDGKQKQSVRRRQGDEQLGPEYWTGDGKLIGYAHYQSTRKATVRSFNPDTREEQSLSPCTQFWNLRGNADNSAVVGECRSKAGPNIYVVFPSLQREITICEHGSSGKPYTLVDEDGEDLTIGQPRPVFSPDSQWIYFTSDRGGTPAVYRASVADMVEKI